MITRATCICIKYLHRVLRYLSFEWRDMSDVGLVEPLDPEMAVEVGRGFAESADSVVL